MSEPRTGTTNDLHPRGVAPIATSELDPILAEVRAIREEYAESLGNDMRAIVNDLRKREAAHPELMVTLEPRRVSGH
jgi:hypothetical protein